MSDSETRIKIKGLGGQGVKFVSGVFGNIVQSQDKYVSIHLDYDAAMRGGGIESTIIVADEPIDCPVTSEFDYLVDMAQNSSVNGHAQTIIKADNNMLALGKLLKALDYNLKKINFKEHLPSRFQDQNINNIKQGYSS